MSRINDEIDSVLRGLAMDLGHDVVSAMLIYRNGFVVSSISRNGVDSKSLSAVLATLKGSIDRMLGKAGLGGSDLIIIRSGRFVIIVTPVNQDVLLANVLHDAANLGLALLAVENAREKISKVVQ
jgi:predicted regulator of Ras-like GTPase activity (Roadblock/LC7/MglB family)